MHPGYVLIAILLSALLIYAAARKLSHGPDVVASYARVGVPESRLNVLAALLIAGAAGLLAGTIFAPLGIAAAASLVVYFLVAVMSHVRFRDTANVATPIVLLVLSLTALVVRAMTAASG